MGERVIPFAQLFAEGQVRETSAVIDGAPEEILHRAIVSGNYFEVLGVTPAIGRTISPADDRERTPVAVISHGFWKGRFDLDPRILGRTIRIANDSFQIIGVAQPGFFGLEVGSMADIWTPAATEPQQRLSVRLIGRLNSGASATHAQGPLQALFHQRMVEMAGHAPPGTPKALIDRLLRLTVKVLPAEKGISSLGATKGRLLRQLMSESMLIASAATVVGLILARWTTPLIVSMLAPSSTPIQLALALDGRVLIFTAVVCILTAVLFGLVPAWRSTVVDLHSTLKSGKSPGRRRARLGKLLVVCQVALSLVLLVGATLFVRTLVNLSTLDPGLIATT